MAKMIENGKWKKRTVTALALALSATLSLGIFTACTNDDTEDEEEDTSATRTDTQLIKNGDFEFYSEMTKKAEDKRAYLNSPTSWTFTSGSPSSDTKSGLIDVSEWDTLTKTGGYPFTTFTKDDKEVTTFASIDEAVAHWTDDNVSVYDRLKFYEIFEDDIDDLSSSSEAKKLFDKYSYSIDFEDVEKLREEIGDEVELHEDVKEGDNGVLMIHNQKTSNEVRGTAQYYTSSTTITLSAGTAAEVAVWVRTDNLYHYYADNNTEVTKRAGAYIGVTHTVGGTTLDQMQIKNIITNGEWQQYTVYVRANTFATTTFKIVLGLGQGTSDNRYEAVDGYAFFDDLTCKIISDSAYTAATEDLGGAACSIDSKAKEKLFDVSGDFRTNDTFALDLFNAEIYDELATNGVEFGLTEEVSGSNTYTSEKIDSSLNDNRYDSGVPEDEKSFVGATTLELLKTNTNGYLKNIVKNDFGEKYPFAENESIIMMLSTNGAAYTAKLPELTLDAGERLLVSFFVKTSAIMNGRSGAGAILVDGENKTAISPFDSTNVTTVDIDDDNKDIYDGWVQCFFFVSNDTEETRSFHVELTYGPTTITGTDKYDYGQGYAAFVGFRTKSLTKTQLSYASTGDRAKKVSLTGSVADSTVFDTASATSDIEKDLALPSSFTGVVSGSKNLVQNGTENLVPEGVYTGLLNYEYAENYTNKIWASTLSGNGDSLEWWKDAFGDSSNSASVARQPLAIVNAGANDAPSYGYFAAASTVSASTYQRISMRVKVSDGAKAFIYLTDTSDIEAGFDTRLTPNLPNVTYWYDDDGNICAKDPSDKTFNKKQDILFYLEDNGLYTKAGADDGVFYANLHNYELQDGNYVTKDGTVAFYGHEGKFYAYRTGDEGAYEYSQPVENLPTEAARYNYTGKTLPESVIEVGPTQGKWVEVAFYVHTGSEAKSYRLEIWAGERTNTENGIPAGGYVLFDNYSSTSISNYDTRLEEAVNALKKDSANLVDPADKTSNLKDAFYYTFTFFDSVSYLRYDVNEDEDELGNPYGSYLQSAYSEQLVALRYDDTDGEQTGVPSYSFFLDYSATDVTVEKDDLGGDTDSGNDTESDNALSTGDILLIVSSGLLAVVLIFAIVAIIVRRALKNRKKTVKVKPAKAKRAKVKPAPEQEEPEPVAEKDEDENDPYNN